MMNYAGDKTQASYGEEYPEFIDLDVDYGGGAVIANNTITTMAGMTVGKYNGQRCFVQYRGGAVDGRVFSIVSNTATVITFEEDVDTAGLADTDEISITLHGVLPTATTEFFGDIYEADMPDPKATIVDHFAHGSTQQPERKDASITKKEYTSSFPVKLLNGKLMLYGLGYVSDTASNFGALNTTTTRAAYIGETKITEALATASGFLATDYVQIGDAAEGPEIRQVASVIANVPVGFDTLVLDKPLRRYHASGAALKECDIGTGKPVTHHLKPWPDVPTICLEAVYKGFDPNHTVNDFVLHYPGIVITEQGFKSAEEMLEVDLTIFALNAVKNTRTRATVINTDWLARKFLFADSTVTINSTIYAQCENLTYGTKRGNKDKYYHTKDTGIKPFEHAMEGFEHNFKLGIPLHNTIFWDLVEDGTKFDASLKYERDATDDYVTFNFVNSYSLGAPTTLTDRTEIVEESEISPGQFSIDFVDTIEYY